MTAQGVTHNLSLEQREHACSFTESHGSSKDSKQWRTPICIFKMAFHYKSNDKQCIKYNKKSHTFGQLGKRLPIWPAYILRAFASQNVTLGIGSGWLTSGWHFVLLLCDDLLLQLPSHPLQCLLPHARDPTPGCQQCACPPCRFAAPSHRITSAILTFPSIMHKNNWGLAAADT